MRNTKNKSDIYDQLNYMRHCDTFQIEEHPFSNIAQSIAFIKHKVMLLMKFLQTKPQIKNKRNYSDLYYTIISKLSDEEGEN